MLSLMLASERSFVLYKEGLMQTQSQENQRLLGDEFDKLLKDVVKSLESQNRDRWARRKYVGKFWLTIWYPSNFSLRSSQVHTEAHGLQGRR